MLLTYLYYSLFSFFILITSYLVITDDRFLLNRKILFFVIIGTLGLISLYMDKYPHDIINDLFWYSLVLNGSFIFHTLILDRLFVWLNKKEYDYLAFLISRISFTLSLSGLLYLLSIIINKKYIYGYKIYFWYSDQYKDNYIITKETFSLIKNWLMWPLEIINVLRVIILHFLLIFKNYELLLLGKTNNNYNINIIMKSIIIFIVFFIIAYIIGEPRLYVIWVFQGLLGLYNIYIKRIYFSDRINYLELTTLKEKIIYLIKDFNHTEAFLVTFNIISWTKLDKIYEKPYHKLFMFDLCRYLYNINTHDLHFTQTEDSDLMEAIKEGLIIFPKAFKSLYKYNTWEEIVINYCGLNHNKDNWTLYEKRCLVEYANYLNKDYNFIKKICKNMSEFEYDITQLSIKSLGKMYIDNFIKE